MDKKKVFASPRPCDGRHVLAGKRQRIGMASTFVSYAIRWWCVSMFYIWISQVEAGGLPLPGSSEVPSKKLYKSLESIALLSLWSQKVMLKMIGEEYVKQNTTHYNGLTVPDYLDYLLCKLTICMVANSFPCIASIASISIFGFLISAIAESCELMICVYEGQSPHRGRSCATIYGSDVMRGC